VTKVLSCVLSDRVSYFPLYTQDHPNLLLMQKKKKEEMSQKMSACWVRFKRVCSNRVCPVLQVTHRFHHQLLKCLGWLYAMTVGGKSYICSTWQLYSDCISSCSPMSHFLIPILSAGGRVMTFLQQRPGITRKSETANGLVTVSPEILLVYCCTILSGFLPSAAGGRGGAVSVS